MKTIMKTETGKSVIVENGCIIIEGRRPIQLNDGHNTAALSQSAVQMLQRSGYDPINYINVQGTVMLKSIYAEARRQYKSLLNTAMEAEIVRIEVFVGCDTSSKVILGFDLPEGFPERFRKIRVNNPVSNPEKALYGGISRLVDFAKNANIPIQDAGTMYYGKYVIRKEHISAVLDIFTYEDECSNRLLWEAKRTGVIQKREISSYELPNEGGYVVVYLNVTPDGKCYETHENVQ